MASIAPRSSHPIRLRPHSAAFSLPMVLHVRVVAGSGGGPDKTILRSAAYADPDTLGMAAAYIHPTGDDGIDTLRQHARTWNCPFLTVPESGAVDPRTLWQLLRICRQRQVSIWHGHDYKSNLLGLILRRLHPMRLVTTAHGWTWDTPRTRLYYRVDNRCLPRYEHVIGVSPRIVEHCRSLGVAQDRLSYVPNGIELAEYQREQSREQRCQSLGLDANHLHLGVVGRLSVEKGVDRAVRMLARLAARHPRLILHLIGEGPGRRDLEALAARLGLGQRVRFWGWQAHAKPFYEMMDTLLLPSHTEGMPNVVLEAMAMGVPAAATDVGGVRELLDQGRCGVILGDQERHWPAQIEPLLVNPQWRAELARQARQRVAEHYSFAQRMARVLAIYDRLLDGQLSRREQIGERKAA